MELGRKAVAWVLTLGCAVGVHGRAAAQGGQAGADPSVLAAGSIIQVQILDGARG